MAALRMPCSVPVGVMASGSIRQCSTLGRPLARARPAGSSWINSPVQEALRITRRGEGFHRESLFETDVPYLHGAAPAPHFAF